MYCPVCTLSGMHVMSQTLILLLPLNFSSIFFPLYSFFFICLTMFLPLLAECNYLSIATLD